MESRAASVAAWVGIAVHLVLGFGYAFTGLLAPRWAVGLLWVIWILLLVTAVTLRRRRPWWTAAVPFVTAALWFLTITLGEKLLGWTA
jgi:hypothetical protein